MKCKYILVTVDLPQGPAQVPKLTYLGGFDLIDEAIAERDRLETKNDNEIVFQILMVLQ